MFPLQMNDTRKDWKCFGCWDKRDSNFTVLSLTGVLGFSTIIFYVGAKKHEKFRHKIQSRT